MSAVEIVLDAAARRRSVAFNGQLDDSQVLAVYAGLLESPDYDYGADDLVDLRGVTHMGVTADGLRRLMASFAQSDAIGVPTRCAIIAPADAVYGVSRMYQMMRGDDVPEVIQVFRDSVSALAWLDEGRGR